MTIRQIAKAFGVAPSTVSVVLNNRPGVRSELRQKIREALVENGYQIREQATHQGNILFIYYKSTNYLAARKDDTIAQTLSGIEDACMDRKFTFPSPMPPRPLWMKSCSLSHQRSTAA